MNRDSGAMADVAIVGGGPAGLIASLTLAQAGLAVTLIDEQRDMGGQYYRQRSGPVRAPAGRSPARGTPSHREGAPGRRHLPDLDHRLGR